MVIKSFLQLFFNLFLQYCFMGFSLDLIGELKFKKVLRAG